MNFTKNACSRVTALFAYHDNPRHFLLTEDQPELVILEPLLMVLHLKPQSA